MDTRLDIAAADLITALRDHASWLDRPGRLATDVDGKLDLSGRRLPPKFNLRRARLANAVFFDADMNGADMSRADLTNADFRRSDMTGVKLNRARCDEAEFYDSRLRDADFTGCKGLNTAQLGGADLTGTTLPAEIAKFELLKTVSEASGQAKTLFIAMLAACGYSWLTIGSTKDAALLTDSTTSPLPLIATSIPIVSFYVIAPILLVLVYAYFHISLHRLWELLADLPSVFPDGGPLDKRAYPWLLVGVVRSRLRILRTQRPPLADLQTAISVLLAYCTVPITLVAFWVRYLPRHDWTFSSLQEGLIVASVGMAFIFYALAGSVLTRETLALPVKVWIASAAVLLLGEGAFALVGRLGGAGHAMEDWARRTFDPMLPFGTHGLIIIIALFAAVCGAALDMVRRFHLHTDDVPAGQMARSLVPRLAFALVLIVGLGILTGGSIEGINPNASGQDALLPRRRGEGIRKWVPGFWQKLRYDPFADISETEVSRKPGPDGRGATPAGLRGRDLSNSVATSAYLAGADLRQANLSRARFDFAVLRDADLSGVDLRGASFDGADLTGADLTGANIGGAVFRNAKGTIAAQFRAALGWQFATLPVGVQSALIWEHSRSSAGRPAPNPFFNLLGRQLLEAELSNLNLTGFDLSGRDIREARFSNTNLRNTQLNDASVFKTDFRGTDIRADQVMQMRGWRLGYYDQVLLGALGLPLDHNKKLESCKLENYDLAGANLSEMDLRCCSFRNSVLSHADLSGANLEDATLEGAVLTGVKANRPPKFFRTNLRDVTGGEFGEFRNCAAELSFVKGTTAPWVSRPHEHNARLATGDLGKANLSGCNLAGLFLAAFDFREANLSNADLTEATVAGARFDGANLSGANLLFIHLKLAVGLTDTQVKKARNWQLVYRPGDLRDLSKQTLTGPETSLVGTELSRTSFRSSDLSGLNLSRTNLTRSEFGGAILTQTTLADANVEWADFRGAQNLTAAQVQRSVYWDSAYFDKPLLKELGLPDDHNEILARLFAKLYRARAVPSGFAPPL